MYPPSIHEEQDNFVQELIEFSTQAATRKRPHAPAASWTRQDSDLRSQSWLSKSYELDHAAPLMPLRERDVEALSEYFDHEHIQEIEADVIRNLLIRWPEPCWEDEPLDFLRDYL